MEPAYTFVPCKFWHSAEVSEDGCRGYGRCYLIAEKRMGVG